MIILFNADAARSPPPGGDAAGAVGRGRVSSPAVIVLVLAMAGLFTGLIARAGFTVLAGRLCGRSA